MQHRNILPRLRRLALIIFGSASLLLAPSARADSPVPSLFSIFSSSEQPTAEAPADTADTAVPTENDELRVHELNPPPLPNSSIDLTSVPENLWDRLRNGFAMADLNDDLTLHYQQWYTNRPDALRRMVERSRPYMHHIVLEIEARGMPTEIALLPMVESSFNPMALSSARAAGLWQFIPATGKRFNLEQNWWQDQRRDIVASTSAALEYLQTIYDMHGDWHLALASYNWGEGAVKRAIEKNTASGLATDYASLRMPNETRHYVPKLQALKNIFRDPVLMARLGLPEILNRPYFATIAAEKPMDVKTAARLANMRTEHFVALNPSHNRPIIKADSVLVIPADRLDTFRQNLASNNEPLSEWQSYTLKSSERANQIAPRFGMPLAELLRINGLSGNVRLGAGSTLLVNRAQNGEGLTAPGQITAPSLIIEPDPPPRAKCRKGKVCKAEKASARDSDQASSRSSAKASNKAGQRVEARGSASKSAARSSGKSSGKAAGKEKAGTKSDKAAGKSGTSSKAAKPAKKSGR